MPQTLRLMDSFSQPERFLWQDGAFTVIIPNGTRTAYHPRASLSRLKALLMPQLRLTRAGNISSHQPAPPPPQPYDFYLGQLIHYGLDFHFEIEAAKRDLEIQIRLGRLQVPSGLLKLEKELKRAHERERIRAYEGAVRNAARQQLGDTLDSAIAVDTSEDESEDEPTQSPAAPRSGQRKRKKQKVAIHSSDESEAKSSDDETSSGSESGPGEESDTIAVAPDFHRDTSSDSSNSSSSREVQEVKRSGSVFSGHNGIDKEFPEEVDEEENSRDDDPFVDRQDFKRIKLEKADEKYDSVLRSTREAAPLIFRKQPPPSRVKIRRVASQPQVNVQPINFTTKETLRSQGVNATFASTSKIPPRKPFVSPDKRPSWTIPVRSPSSFQRDTPKSVTFSQVQPETPTKVPVAEKAAISSAMKTPQRSPHRRIPSISSDHSHTTPLRSILKKTPPHPVKTQTTGDSRRFEIPIQLPHDADATSSRIRKRKRKSEAVQSLDIQLDGARDEQDTPDDSYTEKPYITSDIVNGKPISSLKKISAVQAVQGSSYHENLRVESKGDWVAVNSQSYKQRMRQQQQQANRTIKQDRTGKHTPSGGVYSDEKHDKPGPAKIKKGGNIKDGPETLGNNKNKNRDRDRNSFGNGQQVPSGLDLGIGSGSRGRLVRAGEVY